MLKKIEIKNNIKVILEQMPQLDTVSIGFWFAIGSACETEEQNGYNAVCFKFVAVRECSRQSSKSDASLLVWRAQQTLNDSIWLITSNLANHQAFPQAILHPEPQSHMTNKWLKTLA